MKANTARGWSLAGLAMIMLSGLLYEGLELSSRWEQAKSPSEKSLGVAALSIMFGIPMLACAAVGLLCLIVAGLAFARARVRLSH
jgi:hypothetical protein